MPQDTKFLTFWKNIHEKTAIACCLMMVGGMFFSRALLSFSMFLMILNAIHPEYVRGYWQRWKQNHFNILCLAFFLSYLVSGLWSGNLSYWLASVINKVPFVILPFAFLSVPLSSAKVQRNIIAGLVAMQLLVIIHSLFLVIPQWESYVNGYNFSAMIPTTKYNDHIRFSLSLVLSVFLILYLLLEQKQLRLSSLMKIAGIAVIALFIFYIYLLAAKSGLLCLFLAGILYVLVKVGRKYKSLAIALAFIIGLMPVAGYIAVPTFRTKIDYVRYEYQKTKAENRFDYTLSDAGRMITYDIGGKAISAHPLLGVGAGDIMDEMHAGYDRLYPEVTSDQRYGPINQFMFTALCVGIPLTLILLAMSLSPFFLKLNKRIYLAVAALVLFISLMVEAPLELQFGVFSYLFFMLLWMGILNKTSIEHK